MSRAFSFANHYNAAMRYLAKLILCSYLLLAYVSFAQSDDSIFSRTIEFEDFPGETECVESLIVSCGHNNLDCHTTTVDQIFEGLSNMPSLDADAFICTVSGPRLRGSRDESVTWLRLHRDDQVADINMLYEGSFRSSTTTVPSYTTYHHEDRIILSFDNLDANSYFYISRSTEWSIQYRFTDNNLGEVISIRHHNEKFLHIFSIAENSVVLTKEIPLTDYADLKGSLDEPLSETIVKSYEEWLETVNTPPDQLTYTLDWPNTLTISVNPGTEPTEAQLEWVGVHDLSAVQQ
ncbi:MAG: hypothetical protein AAF708_11010 [Deinococcota bacterium]